jgi:hypothetical protein
MDEHPLIVFVTRPGGGHEPLVERLVELADERLERVQIGDLARPGRVAVLMADEIGGEDLVRGIEVACGPNVIERALR